MTPEHQNNLALTPPSSRLFSILPVRVLSMFCLSRSPVLII